MKIFKQIAPLRSFLEEIKSAGKTIGLVPTMGALHNGHISLVRASNKENNVTVATIYVNPTQFNNASDLLKYPRTIEHDLEMLENNGCEAVFCPTDQEMYAEKSALTFDFGPLDKVMEGKFRPGHFSGVALVVAKLFNIVQPHKAYFGQKDWQQVAIIKRLVHELKFNLVVATAPTIRESDGLAMSSRNQRLTPQLRAQAPCIYESLVTARSLFSNGANLESVKKAVQEHIEKSPDMKLEYFELADRGNLSPLSTVVKDAQPIMCIAAFAGEVRLIDNMFLD